MALKMTSFYFLGQNNWNEINLVILCHCHWCQCHLKLMASSMTPFYSLCKNDWKQVQHDFLVMCCQWHWHKQHVMLLTLSMVPLHFVGQDDWKGVQVDFSGDFMPFTLMLASHDAISIFKGTTTFLTWRHQNKEQHAFFWSFDTAAITIGITCCH